MNIRRNQQLYLFWVIGLLILLVAAPVFAQPDGQQSWNPEQGEVGDDCRRECDDGRDDDDHDGDNHDDDDDDNGGSSRDDDGRESPSPDGREDPPTLTLPPAINFSAWCERDGTPVFEAVNVGAQPYSAPYQIVETNTNAVVDNGALNLAPNNAVLPPQPGQSGFLQMVINGNVVADVTCGEEPDAAELVFSAACEEPDGTPVFDITNIGNAAYNGPGYEVVDANNVPLQGGVLNLAPGASVSVSQPGYSGLLALVINGATVATVNCEPPAAQPELDFAAWCDANGAAIFEITNVGGAAYNGPGYEVVDMNAVPLQGGLIQLNSGQSVQVQQPGGPGLVMLVVDGIVVASVECNLP